jgi:hypothetical protein
MNTKRHYEKLWRHIYMLPFMQAQTADSVIKGKGLTWANTGIYLVMI